MDERTIVILVLVLALAVFTLLYLIYEPFLDIVESGGQRWLVVWYTRNGGRECMKLLRLR